MHKKASISVALAIAAFVQLALGDERQASKISEELETINHWLTQNPLEPHETIFHNIKRAGEFYESEKTILSLKEQKAWDTFAQLAKLEAIDCSWHAAHLVHENFRQVALEWPDQNEGPKLHIQTLMLHLQEEQLKKCENKYEELICGVGQSDSLLESHFNFIGDFIDQYDSLIASPEGKSNKFPGLQQTQFVNEFTQTEPTALAKAILETFKATGNAMIHEKAHEQDYKSLVAKFYHSCFMVINSFSEKVELLMMSRATIESEQHSHMKQVYQRVEVCNMLSEHHKQEQLVAAMMAS